MNTWLTDVIRKTNERPFADADLARMMAYFAKLPARLKLAAELEKLEPGLAKKLHDELAKRHPDRAVYTRPLAGDLVESLRHVALAALADDPTVLRHRWTDHLARLLPALEVDPSEIRDAYLALRDLVEKKLTQTAWDAFATVFDEMTDALTAVPAPAPAVPV